MQLILVKDLVRAPYGRFCLLTLCLPLLCAADWPQWRGANRDGNWAEAKIRDRLPERGLKLRWKQPIGGGYAGIAVANSRVFTLDYQKKPDELERVIGFDAESGKEVWQHAYAVKYGKMEYGNGPRSTPTVYQNRVYTFGARGHLVCLSAETGKPLWQRDTAAEFQGRVPMWGHACSPLVEGELLIVQVGGEPNACIVAFDRKTGKEQWRSLGDRPGYSSPVMIATTKGRQLVCWTAEHLAGLEPSTGKVLWNFPYATEYDVTISDPVYINGVLLVSDYWKGSKAIRLNDEGKKPQLVWEGRRLSLLMSTPLIRDGFVYALDKRDGLKCIELATGKVQWQGEHVTPAERNPHASLVWAGTRALILNTPGELILAELSPNGYRQLSKTAIIDGTWAHPAYAHGCVFVRNDKELACYSLLP